MKAGADRIKLIPTGIINFKKGAVTAEPQMTAEEFASWSRPRRSFGKQTFAHASGDAGIERAIEGGVDSIEHGFFVRDDQLAKMRDRQIAWVPTFAPVQKQVDHADLMGWDADGGFATLKRILDQHAASLVKAHEMGVQIIAGSDAGSYGVAHGLGFLERTGIDGTRRTSHRLPSSNAPREPVQIGWRSRRNSGKSSPAFSAASFSRAIRHWKALPICANIGSLSSTARFSKPMNYGV